MTTSAVAVSHHRVVIVGAGFAGIGAAAALRRAGIEDFVILERAAELGGVWRDNVYPGCACDVQSHLYQYAALPNPGLDRARRRVGRSGTISSAARRSRESGPESDSAAR
ncbi:MAG: NAD(P)-binding protein [Gemmatimonadales bacterium]